MKKTRLIDRKNTFLKYLNTELEIKTLMSQKVLYFDRISHKKRYPLETILLLYQFECIISNLITFYIFGEKISMFLKSMFRFAVT